MGLLDDLEGGVDAYVRLVKGGLEMVERVAGDVVDGNLDEIPNTIKGVAAEAASDINARAHDES